MKTYYDRESPHILSRLIEHSVTETGAQAFTFNLIYPLSYHAEVMTYCSAAKNAASSRAIPTVRLMDRVAAAPVVPLVWLRNQAGMQGGEELDDPELEVIWREAAADALRHARRLADKKVHKQTVNRLLAPFLTISTLFTVGRRSLGNMLAQRRHPAAQPEMQRLAQTMLDCVRASKPRLLVAPTDDIVAPSILGKARFFDMEHALANELLVVGATPHAPYSSREEFTCLWDTLVQSTARCARVSYEKHEGGLSTFDDDERLFQALLMPNDDPLEPKHMSPTEHVLFPLPRGLRPSAERDGKIPGFVQLRRLIAGEVAEFPWDSFPPTTTTEGA